MGICGSTPNNHNPYANTVKNEAHDTPPAPVYKLLLLGAGESGKSTLFRQIQHLHNPQVVPEDEKRHAVHSNIFLCLKAFSDHGEKFGTFDPEVQPFVDRMKAIDVNRLQESEVKLNIDDLENYKKLWADPTTQLAWDNRSSFQIYGCAEYFLSKIEEIMHPDYQVTQDDLLQTRVRTSGIVESKFTIDGQNFALFDVGGQRNERKKWIHCFENVTAVIFVSAISEYDQKLFEDETTNRLDESLKLFAEICLSRWFNDTSLILFLNKSDLFNEKIMRVSLADYFPEYEGPEKDPIAAQEWITEQFKNKAPGKTVYANITCATDTDNVKNVFDAVKDIVISSVLQQSGFS